MAIINMKMVTEVQPLTRLDFEPAQISLINPVHSPGTPSEPMYLLDGEFLMINNDYKLSREGGGTSVTGGKVDANPADVDSVSKATAYPLWMERGRYDMQAISGGRVTVLFSGGFLADFHADVLNPADSFVLGDKLYCNWLSDVVLGNNQNRRRGLTKTLNAADKADAVVMGEVVRVFPAGSPFRIRAKIWL